MTGWTWTCTACGEAFGGDTKDEAQGKFLSHANEKHPKAIIVSMDGTTGK